MADAHAGVWADLSVVATDYADRRARKNMLRDERRRRRRRQLAAAMLEADNDAILHQIELLATLQPDAAVNAAMNLRFAHESAILLQCDVQGDPRDVFIEPMQSMRALTYEYLGMAPNGYESQVDTGYSSNEEDKSIPPVSSSPPRSLSIPQQEQDEKVPDRTSKLYQRVKRYNDSERNVSDADEESDTSNEALKHSRTDPEQLQSFRERVFDPRVPKRNVSGKHNALSATMWPEDATFPIADADETFADILGPPEISVFESFDSSRDSHTETEDNSSRPSRILADATRRVFRTSESVGPLAPILQRRRTMHHNDHSSRKWTRPKRIIRALLGKSHDGYDDMHDLNLGDGGDGGDEGDEGDEVDGHISEMKESSNGPRQYKLAHESGPIFVPAPLEHTAFQERTDDLWNGAYFYTPHGAFMSTGGIIVPHSDALPNPEDATKQGPFLDIGPVAVPNQIGRRVLYPTTALFRNALVRNSDEHEGWGWERNTCTTTFFEPLEADDSDSDDDEPLMEVRIQAREHRIAARRIARERARQRRLQRGPGAPSDSESGDASADADESDPEIPWRDDFRPAGRLYGTNLIDLAGLQDKEKKALMRFYGQANLDGGDTLGLYDTRERMERAFGKETQWHNEMVARLQRDAMQDEDQELAAKSLEQLRELAARVAAQTSQEPETTAPSPPQRRPTHFRRNTKLEDAPQFVDETVAEWRTDDSSEESDDDSGLSEDDVPLAKFQHDSDEERPLGELYPQAGIISEQASFIRYLLAENQQARMSLGMFGFSAPQMPAVPMPPWMYPRETPEAKEPQTEPHEEHNELIDEPLIDPLPEHQPENALVPLDHFAGELPEHAIEPEVAALIDPDIFEQHDETSLAQAEAAAPVNP